MRTRPEDDLDVVPVTGGRAGHFLLNQRTKGVSRAVFWKPLPVSPDFHYWPRKHGQAGTVEIEQNVASDEYDGAQFLTDQQGKLGDVVVRQISCRGLRKCA